MAKAFRLPVLDEATVAALQQQYDTTSDADLRLRTQMVLLAHRGRSVSETAQIAFRSQDTVLRHLKPGKPPCRVGKARQPGLEVSEASGRAFRRAA